MNATTSPRRPACAMILMVASAVLAGCAMSSPEPPEQEAVHQRFHWDEWPPDAMFVEIEVGCACPGQSLELGGRFHANWTAQPAEDGPTSSVRDQAHAEWFQWALYQDLDDPDVTGHAGVWQQFANAVGTAYTYTAMADAGIGPAPEVTVLQSGIGGGAFVSYTQAFPLVVPLDGEDLHLVMVATNGTGLRREPQAEITMDVPPEAEVTTRFGTNMAFAYDEPTFGRGQGVDLAYPARAHARNFGPSELVVDHRGTLSYGFLPWIPVGGGVRDATYSVAAADHSYRMHYQDIQGNAQYECLDGCDGLGMSYADNMGFAPPGTTTFRIDDARCLSETGCRGALVGVDLGDAEVLERAAWTRQSMPEGQTPER